MSSSTPAAEAWSEIEQQMMARALQLAQRGLYTTDPNPRVGCVLAQGERIVAEGWHQRAGEAHAEAMALAAAGDRARGSTAYVTLEPCNHQGRTPPCTEALLGAGVAQVIYALRDPNTQVRGGGDQFLRDQGVRVRAGLLAEASAELNCGYVKRMATGLPFVRIKLAMSLDGRTALASGESRWITAEPARKDAQRYRARSSAIITGIGTVLADDPAMNVRLPGTDRQPLRVVLDSDMRTPPQSRIVQREGTVWVLAAREQLARRVALEAQGVQVQVLADAQPQVPLLAVLQALGAAQANEVWVEAGAKLAGAFVAAGLFDELVVYVAPTLLGPDARPLLHLPGLGSLEQRQLLRYTEITQVDGDLRLTLQRA